MQAIETLKLMGIARLSLGALAAAALGGVLLVTIGCGSGGDQALKIGLVSDYSGSLAHISEPIENGARLAVEHIEEAGGVNGNSIELVLGDSATDPTRGALEAQRLINVEGVSAIIGAVASGVTIGIAEYVTVEARVPQISAASSSSDISVLNDNDFLFRTSLADKFQGTVMANDVLERYGNESNVGILHVNNPYGRRFAEATEQNFDGEARVVAYDERGASFTTELREAAAGGAEALVLIGYAEDTEIILREALESQLFSSYYFTDGNDPADLDLPFDTSALNGSYGTAPGTVPAMPDAADPSSSDLFAAAYSERFGAAAPTAFAREAYDAVVAIALAAQAAQSNDGEAIRDNLRAVANSPGTAVKASVDSLREGLELVEDGSDVNYEGTASALEWDSNGDITGGFVEVRQHNNGESEREEIIFVGS